MLSVWRSCCRRTKVWRFPASRRVRDERFPCCYISRGESWGLGTFPSVLLPLHPELIVLLNLSLADILDQTGLLLSTTEDLDFLYIATLFFFLSYTPALSAKHSIHFRTLYVYLFFLSLLLACFVDITQEKTEFYFLFRLLSTSKPSHWSLIRLRGDGGCPAHPLLALYTPTHHTPCYAAPYVSFIFFTFSFHKASRVFNFVGCSRGARDWWMGMYVLRHVTSHAPSIS